MTRQYQASVNTRLEKRQLAAFNSLDIHVIEYTTTDGTVVSIAELRHNAQRKFDDWQYSSEL